MDECLVVSEPLGLVLIVGSWCSPVQLCLVPLVGAVAAGEARALSRKGCLLLVFVCHTLKLRFTFSQGTVPSSALLSAAPTRPNSSIVCYLFTSTM